MIRITAYTQNLASSEPTIARLTGNQLRRARPGAELQPFQSLQKQ